MYMKVPEVNRSCFCCSLRWGIILLGSVNLVFCIAILAWLVWTPEQQKLKVSIGRYDYTLEEMIAAFFLSVCGMGVLLNIMVLIASFQKDTAMLRLYKNYAIAITVASLVPICILIPKMPLLQICVAVITLVFQCYVIVLVKSEHSKLEKNRNKIDEENPRSSEEIVDVPDRDTLL